MRARSRRDQGARLLNVAISRARRQVVILADFPYLRSSTTPTDAVIRRLLNLFEAEENPLRISEHGLGASLHMGRCSDVVPRNP